MIKMSGVGFASCRLQPSYVVVREIIEREAFGGAAFLFRSGYRGGAMSKAFTRDNHVGSSAWCDVPDPLKDLH